MAVVDSADLISISEANNLGVSALIRDAEGGRTRVVLRNNRPVAAVISIKRLDEIQRLEEDLVDASLAAARMMTTSPNRHTLDDVLNMLGYTREDLRELPE